MFAIIIFIFFANLNAQKLSLNVSSGYKFENFEIPIVFADVPLSVDLEYFPLEWLSVYAGFEKFSGAFSEDLFSSDYYQEHLSYSLPKLGFNYYPIIYKRSKVCLGAFVGQAFQNLNTIYSVTMVYNEANNTNRIIGIEFGDYKKNLLTYGMKMAYSYEIIRDKINLSFILDYTKFVIESNTFPGVLVSAQIQVGIILF